jgi:uncharacterized hydrophobic protein (TIGR00271 family)
VQNKKRQSTPVTGQTFDEAIAEVLGPDASDEWGEKGIWFHHRLAVADRADVLQRVFLDSDPRWLSAFIIMLLLSGGIATLGLSSDSAATVIGSMVVAPLGGPIVAFGGAIATVWPREAVKMFLTIIVGALAVVLVAYIMGIFLPQATPNAQILARTNPDLRDLGVALLAGAAGGYAQTRPSLASSLVGVAIAVALVPPLATVGLMLEAGHWALALGATTLFVANFVGITLAVVVTLLLTRYAPLPRLRPASTGLAVGLGVTVLAIGLLMIPLGNSYLNVIRSSQTVTAVHEQVSTTLGSTSSAVVNHIDVNGANVVIDLSDVNGAPSAAQFAADLVDELGEDVKVELR